MSHSPVMQILHCYSQYILKFLCMVDQLAAASQGHFEEAEHSNRKKIR